MELTLLTGLRQRRRRSGPKFPGRPRHQLARRQAPIPAPPQAPEEADAEVEEEGEEGDDDGESSDEGGISSSDEEGVTAAGAESSDSDSEEEVPGAVNAAESDSEEEKKTIQPPPPRVTVKFPSITAPALNPALPTATIPGAIAPPVVSVPVAVGSTRLSQRPFITIVPPPPANAPAPSSRPASTISLPPPVTNLPVAGVPIQGDAARPISSTAESLLLPLPTVVTGDVSSVVGGGLTATGEAQLRVSSEPEPPTGSAVPSEPESRGAALGIAFGVTGLVAFIIGVFILARQYWKKKKLREAGSGLTDGSRTPRTTLYGAARTEKTDSVAVFDRTQLPFANNRNYNDMEVKIGYYEEKKSQGSSAAGPEVPPKAASGVAPFRESMNANYQAYNPSQTHPDPNQPYPPNQAYTQQAYPNQMYQQQTYGDESSYPPPLKLGSLPVAPRGPDGRFSG